MGNVNYKKPPESMKRMVIQNAGKSRPSIGMTEVKGEIYYLSPDIIIPYKNQARREIDETALEELSLSIKTHGIINHFKLFVQL